jgi:Cu(I)/Ag(I) efflux system membrane fusion protein
MTKVTAGELTAEQTRRMGVETTVLSTGPAVATVRAYGTAEYDNRHTKLVIPRVAGRIVARHEATYGCCEIVAAGAPIVDLYSETLIAAQAELQAALKLNDDGLVAALRERFARWNLSPVADAIVAGGPVQDIVTITSPFAGQVLLADEEMVNETLAVGREIAADTPLLRLVDPDKLVLVVHVPEHRANWIALNQPVLIDSDDAGPLPQLKAVVGRVFSEINPMLRAREVRVYLENAREILSPGSLVNARFQVALAPDLRPADANDRDTWGDFVLIPKTAVLSTGVRHVAWKVAGRDAEGRARFELAPLALGPRLEDAHGNDLYVVRAGLSAGDEVAAQGAFLIDSQAQLAGTPSLLYPLDATAPAAAHSH